MKHHAALQFFARTDPGLVRPHNEDAVEVSAGYGIAVLADGMGGYNAGEIASGIATSAFKSHLEYDLQGIAGARRAAPSKALLKMMVNAVEFANAEILNTALTQPEFSGMGTTLVAALFQQNRIGLAHVGDSRAYRYRDGELIQLTRDHSQLQEQIDAGLVSAEWARFAPNKNLITRALGVAAQIDVETSVHFMQQGDVYLLCSDGLSDMLSATHITTLFNEENDLEALGDRLIQTANDNGGRDNISLILVRVGVVPSAVPRRWMDRLMTWLK